MEREIYRRPETDKAKGRLFNEKFINIAPTRMAHVPNALRSYSIVLPSGVSHYEAIKQLYLYIADASA